MPKKITRNIHKHQFPNGLTLLTEPMKHVRSVAMGIWLKTGSRQESIERNGITHFIEHLVFKGTKTRTAKQIAREMDSVGGHLDAFTTKECVCFNAVVLDQHSEPAFDVLSDMVLNPLFEIEELNRERGVVLEELKAEQDNSDYLAHEIFVQKFWKGHALARPILGTKRSITSLSRRDVQDQFRLQYRPENMVISFAGHIDHSRIREMVHSRFHQLRPSRRKTSDSRPVAHPHITLRNKDSLEQAQVCLGVPAYPLAHEKRFGCYLLNTILGGGMSSRLFQKIRERQGLVYSVYSDLTPYRDAGGLLVNAGTSPRSVPTVLASILEELNDLKENLVSEEELERAVNQLKGSILLGLESSSSRMSNMARQEMYFGRFFSIEEIIGKIESVTSSEIQQIARDLFQREKIAFSVLGRLNGLKITRRMLDF